MYSKIGSDINVQYSFLATPAMTLTTTSVQVTIPFNANPSATPRGSGSFYEDGTFGTSVIVTAFDATHVTATFKPVGTSAAILTFNVRYVSN